MVMGSGGSPLARTLDIVVFRVWWLHTLSQAEHVTNPTWASVSFFVICMWVPLLLGDGPEHGLVLEGLGSNLESTTF